MQTKSDPETVADAMRDLTCAAALLDAGYSHAQGIADGFNHAATLDGWTMLERAADLLDAAMCALQPIAARA